MIWNWNYQVLFIWSFTFTLQFWLEQLLTSIVGKNCKSSFDPGILISRFLDQVLIHGIYIRKRHVLTPYFMSKMHVIYIFVAFYIREKIVLANIAKTKRSRKKDGLQYLSLTYFWHIFEFDLLLTHIWVWPTFGTYLSFLASYPWRICFCLLRYWCSVNSWLSSALKNIQQINTAKSSLKLNTFQIPYRGS